MGVCVGILGWRGRKVLSGAGAEPEGEYIYLDGCAKMVGGRLLAASLEGE